jgi:hypothetical protein
VVLVSSGQAWTGDADAGPGDRDGHEYAQANGHEYADLSTDHQPYGHAHGHEYGDGSAANIHANTADYHC